MIQAILKGKDIKVIVWAAFWGGGVSNLYLLERDWEVKKMGYSTNSYINILKKNLTQFYQSGQIFMQDNAPIYTTKKVRL